MATKTMEKTAMNRIKTAKLILWSILGFSSVVMIARFVFGLGAVTNLNDATPWGLWIGFDVLGGVALAAGGFVLTALFYVFKKEEFHPVVRPALLTAFLGYLAVIVGLLFDLGLPWHIWHPVIHWQPHSPLFEVGWCVMLYTTVLALEFFPVPLEATNRFAKIRRFLTRYRLVLVVLGIMLSTLHQSSLGSLFLIMPYRLPEFWYSPLLPVYFFISAIVLGFMMVSFESLVTSYLYEKKPETHLVAKLGNIGRWVLVVYLLLKVVDLGHKGVLLDMFNGEYESNLFLAEMLVMVIIPIILLSTRSIRESHTGQWITAIMVVDGVVFNRLNVGGITMMKRIGMSYLPSCMEIAVSAGVVSGAALIFFFAIEHFNIWERKPQDPEADPTLKPALHPLTKTWLGTPATASRVKYSIAFVLFAGIALAFIPYHSIKSGGVHRVAVMKARGGNILKIDGNDDGFLVSFNHKLHIQKNGEEESCALCHHMNLPQDTTTACSECHRDMFLSLSIFNHTGHQTELGGNRSCMQCHPEGQPKSGNTAKKCQQCHTDSLSIYVQHAPIKTNGYFAVSYIDAMHGLCIACHKIKEKTLNKVGMSRCTTCHTGEPDPVLTAGKQWRAIHYNSWVITPMDSIYWKVMQELKKRAKL